MSVNELPVFPIELKELLARAASFKGSTWRDRTYAALKGHPDTLQFLQDMKPHAFIKGVAKSVLPRPKSQWDMQVQRVVMDAIFATAKTVRVGEVSVPGRKGKVTTTVRDMLHPEVQYGFGGDDVDFSALNALASLDRMAYTIDDAKVHADADAFDTQQDWAHKDHPLQDLDSDLRRFGIYADTPQEALQALEAAGNPDQDLRAALEGRLNDRSEPMREYQQFKTRALYARDDVRGQSIQPRMVSPEVQAALQGALLISGNWESLGIPRRVKAEAFDRLVSLFAASFTRQRPGAVAAITDDLIGQVATVAARSLGIPTIAVQVAGWPSKVATHTLQWCERLPKGQDLALAQQELRVYLSEQVWGVLTLGTGEEITQLKEVCARWPVGVKPRSALDGHWQKHNGLY
ncbi:hypothetical protein [Deinococcus sp. Leaf326]|uniref:hypothetical protein n=1 Tax=Deinococcus sp. Leaf326 TaxID=1736338 RepID=UPI0006F44A04|nr:hypothetical protein [Deinococcus sp. Leaf326]KQR21875.1 hypothetical protein ASF71_19410 [Deinococcus sp. Leaf326]